MSTVAILRRLPLLVAMAMIACRFRYDELAIDAEGGRGATATAGTTGATGATAAGEGAAIAGARAAAGGENAAAGSETSMGGATDGGTPGTPAGGTSAMAGAGGSGAVPPDPQLCSNKTFGGHDYLLCSEERSWTDAAAGCLAVGMGLVRIDDATENQWLSSNAVTQPGRSSQIWIGASDAAVEGEWRWSDGELFWLGANNGVEQNGLFSAWYFREPNDVNSAEDCGSLETKSSGLEWYDAQCSLAMPFICESL